MPSEQSSETSSVDCFASLILHLVPPSLSYQVFETGFAPEAMVEWAHINHLIQAQALLLTVCYCY